MSGGRQELSEKKDGAGDGCEFTADALEAIFHKALGDGDVKGVEAALTLMAAKDPRRAQRLYDALDLSLKILQVGGHR